MASYEEIKRQCKRTGRLYEDPDFRAVESSVFVTRKPPRPFVWKRPSEICADPHMFVGGAGRLDIQQGMLGDCWLLAAISSLTEYEKLLYNVVPQDQDVDPNSPDYCGAVRFRLWQFGEWKEIVIDDRLPTYNEKLVFVHSSEKNEFWSALLEKAYAKTQGSYESLKGGQTSEAMEDFTGGLAESYELKKAPRDLFKIMHKASIKSSLMGCSIEAKPNEIEAKGQMGLIKGHAYSVTGVQHVKAKTRRGDLDVELVRIRNPWGNEREWEGAWSDKSGEWGLISDSDKQKLGLTFDDDGEFWMSFDDFKRYFTRLEICMLGPDSSSEGSKKTWEARCEGGNWRRNWTAGGCRNFPDTFHINPQFRITLEDPDDDDELDNCSFVVALMQKDRRKEKVMSKGKGGMLTMGFAIYKVTDDVAKDSKIPKDFFLYNKSTARSATFINSREISGRFSLPPGEYVVVPSTFNPGDQGDFIMRLYAEKAHQTSEVDTETSVSTDIVRKPQITQEQHSSLDAKFKDFFVALSGEDEQIDAFELQELLSKAYKKEMNSKDFSLEACRSLISMVDEDESGKMGFCEFKELWISIRRWKGVFDQYDTDKSGDMNLYELRDALKNSGFALSNKVLNSMAMRFNNKSGRISFDDYLQIMARLHTLFKAFTERQSGRGQAVFSLDQYLRRTLPV